MPSPGEIRAGRAFVEVFAETSDLSRSLKKAQDELRTFQAAQRELGRLNDLSVAGPGATTGERMVAAQAASQAADLSARMRNQLEIALRRKEQDVSRAHSDALLEDRRRTADQDAAIALDNYRQRVNLEDRYFDATHSRRDVDLRNLQTYYARLRAQHAGNTKMLSLIDQAYAAERNALLSGKGGVFDQIRTGVAAIKALAVTRAVSGGMDVVTASVRLAKGNVEGFDEAMGRLPFGFGQVWRSSRELGEEILGMAEIERKRQAVFERGQRELADFRKAIEETDRAIAGFRDRAAWAGKATELALRGGSSVAMEKAKLQADYDRDMRELREKIGEARQSGRPAEQALWVRAAQERNKTMLAERAAVSQQPANALIESLNEQIRALTFSGDAWAVYNAKMAGATAQQIEFIASLRETLAKLQQQDREKTTRTNAEKYVRDLREQAEAARAGTEDALATRKARESAVGGHIDPADMRRIVEAEEALAKARRDMDALKTDQERSQAIEELGLQTKLKGYALEKAMLDLQEKRALESAAKAGENLDLVRKEYDLRRRLLGMNELGGTTLAGAFGGAPSLGGRIFAGEFSKPLDKVVAATEATTAAVREQTAYLKTHGLAFA